MDNRKLMGIIRALVGDEECYETVARGRDSMVSAHCTNIVTHVGTSGDARCAEHLAHFTEQGEEYVSIVDECATRDGATRQLVYLACPYSHPDRAVRAERFNAANKAAGVLMSHGFFAFSPISHTHPIAEECELPKGWDFWQAFDRAYLANTRMLVVLCIDGWRESTGVTAEIAIAKELGIPITYMLSTDGLMTDEEPSAILTAAGSS